jgi:cobalt-zinc-cadmium efflux system protein
VTYLALRLGTKSATFKQTFGYIRAEMMAAFVNTLFLYVTMIYMIYEAINRFFNPEIIDPLYMIIVGTIAVIANGISAYILNTLGVDSCSHSHHHEQHHEHTCQDKHQHTHTTGHTHEDANIHSAYLHMLSDALISVAVVVAGIFIYYFKIYYIDSILTILFSAYILMHSYGLLKKSFLSLMDMNISAISQKELEEIILSNEQVVEYHDLHINNPSSKHTFISYHLVLKDVQLKLQEIEDIVQHQKEKLKAMGFNHSVIQVDSTQWIKNQAHCSLH